MASTITEYSCPVALAKGSLYSITALPEPAIRTIPFTIGSSVSTSQVGSGTNIVRLDIDTGCFILFTSSGSTVVATSTNASHYSAGSHVRVVPPNCKITTLST
jgi:hypothetical protein